MHKYSYVILIFLSTLLSSCYITRAYKHRKFELKDLDKLDYTRLSPASTPFYFTYNLDSKPALKAFLDTTLENTFTYSFLVIKNDSIIYEKYFDGLNEKTKQPSFSVAKSFVGTLMQMAVEDGFIKSLQEPITNYLPYLAKNDDRFNQITIQHVMNMATGIKSSENYSNPFSDVLHLGFTKNITNQLKKIKIESNPGKFDYKSVNTQLLAAIIEASTQQKLQDYFHKKLWQPLGMENEATWNIDSKKNSTLRAFCCLNATTKDFAKLGKLYLQKGYYNGKQLISKAYVLNTTNPDSMLANDGYKNQWWAKQPYVYFTDSAKAIKFLETNTNTQYHKKIEYKDKSYFAVKDNLAPFYAEGILEQFVFVNPRTNTIVVRMGHYWNHKKYNALQVIEAASSLSN